MEQCKVRKEYRQSTNWTNLTKNW